MLQLVCLFALSVVVHVTGVYPDVDPAMVKLEPEAGTQTVEFIPEASDTVGVNVARTPGNPPLDVML